MSGTLTEPAPAEGSEDPAVADQSSEAEGEVGGGSVQEAESVSAERFNGLMGSFNKEKDRAEKAEARLAELEAQMAEERLDTTPTEKETEVSDGDPRIDQLAEQVQALTQVIEGVATNVGQTRQETIAEKVFQEYPEAQAFADLIVAEDEESYRGMAEEIANRVRSLRPQEEQTSEEAPAASEAPAEATGQSHPLETQAGATTAGGPPVNPEDNVADRRRSAVEKRDWDGFFAAVRDEEDTEPVE